MKKIKIKLEKIKDANRLVQLATKEKDNVWLSDDNGVKVSGKSILGVFDVGVDSVMNVEYSEDANEDFEDFLRQLEFKATAFNVM